MSKANKVRNLIKYTIIFVLSCFLLLSCKPKYIKWRGKSMPKDQAIKMAYEEGYNAYTQKKYKTAISRFRKYLDTFTSNQYSDNALFYLGNIYFYYKKYERAIRYYKRVFDGYKKSELNALAGYNIAKAYKKLGDFNASNEYLGKVNQLVFNRDQKIDYFDLYASNFIKLKNNLKALNYYYKKYHTLVNPAEKQKTRAKLLDIIDSGLSYVDLRRAAVYFKSVFPGGYCNFKLAKLYFHIKDFEKSKETLEDFIGAFRDHEYKEYAKLLLDKIKQVGIITELKIGVILPLSGKYSAYGERVLDALIYSAEIFKKENSADLKFEIRDSKSTEKNIRKVVDDLILNEKVITIIGPITRKASFEASFSAQEYKTPIITLSQREDITKIGEYVFRVGLTKSAQVKALVKYAKQELGINGYSVLYPNHPYGKSFLEIFEKGILQNKGELVVKEAYKLGAQDFSTEIKKMVGLYNLKERKDELCSKTRRRNCYKPDELPPIIDFEAIFLPDMGKTVSLIIPALPYNHVRGVQILGTNSLNQEEFLQRTGVEYTQGIIFVDGFFKDSARAEIKEFVKAYNDTYGYDPDVLVIQAIDAMSIVKNVLAKLKNLSRKVFKQTLVANIPYKGVTGKIRFDAEGDIVKELFVLTVDEGVIKELK